MGQACSEGGELWTCAVWVWAWPAWGCCQGAPEASGSQEDHPTRTMKEDAKIGGQTPPIDGGEAKSHILETRKRAQNLFLPSPILLFHKQFLPL